MIVAYEITLLVMILIEYKYYRSYFTPFSIMGCCYMIVPIFLNTIGAFGNLYKMTEINYLCSLIFASIMWSANLLFIVVNRSSILYNSERIQECKKRTNEYMKLYQLAFIICILMFATTVMRAILTYGIIDTKNRTVGIGAHFGYIGLMLAPYILYDGIESKTKSKYIYIMLFVLELVVLQNKLPVVVLLLQCMYFFFFMNGRVHGKKIIKTGILVVLGVFVLFVVVYSIRPWLIDKNASLDASVNYAIERFFHYFFSGFISSNEYFISPSGNMAENGYRVAFGFVDTLLVAIFGGREYVDPVIHKWVFISPDSATNVGGLFSELVFQIGYIGAGIYIFFVGALVYFFFNQAVKKNRYINTAAYLVALTTVSFFCNFFALFSTFEKFVYVFMLDTIIIFAKRKRIKVKFSDKKLKFK